MSMSQEGLFMKKLLWAVLAWSLLSTVSRAQETPRVDVATGYSFFYIVKGFTIPMNGANGTVAVHSTNWLALAGDAGVYHNVSNDLTATTYTFGPRIYYYRVGHSALFAQALLGGTHFSKPFGQEPAAQGNHFTYSFGFGADVPLLSGGKLALRPQIDYYGVQINGARLNNVRFAIGLVLRFGRRR